MCYRTMSCACLGFSSDRPLESERTQLFWQHLLVFYSEIRLNEGSRTLRLAATHA